ncbi:hypothetical protein Y032_0520g2848 [Ancylostoma ceylanicum]|uniref:Uncharacterized protein n=2 Tax=Ancylostoma ceylanicum TaxID=53326 RepID=A0A016WSU7_9BILA|nr:hypothetical protein Y032_0520g2848 [Ancylostoma ceylanicum]
MAILSIFSPFTAHSIHIVVSTPVMGRKSLWSLLFLLAVIGLASSSVTPSKLNGIKSLAMTDKEFKRVQQLHYGWYIQAVSALLGAMGKELYMKMDRNNRRAFVACLDNIDKEHDLQSGAQCLVKAFDKKLVKSYPYALHRPYYDFVGDDLKRSKNSKKKKLIRKAVKDFARSRAAKLLKLNFTKKAQLLRNPSGQTKPIVSRARKRGTRGYSKRILKANQPSKVLEKRRGWKAKVRRSSTVVRRHKRNVLSLYKSKETIEEAKRLDRMDSPYRPVNMQTVPSLISKEKTPVKVLTDFLGSVWRVTTNKSSVDRMKLHNSYTRLQLLQNKVMEMKREGQFKHRMLDMVVGKNNPLRRRKSFTERFRDLVPDKVVDESVYGLVDSVSRHTNDVNSQFLSPRILPLLPDKYSASKKLLSPDLFPFYKDDTGNSVLPIPEVLEKSGLNPKDRDSILELVMDVAGVNDVVENSLDLLKNMKTVGLDKDLMKITSAIDAAFDDIKNSLVVEQRRELAGRQFSFLNRDQLNRLYGKEGILNTTLAELPFDLDEYGAMSHEEREESLRNTVRLLAEDPKSLHRRYKRTIKIQFFRHTTLAPYAFAPTILTLNVLGPVTLSPSLFSPNIVSPLLLSPPVISPQVGNPLILSPYVLGPNVLSAAVMNAYVLSPYVLSPNVINPYVLSPLILSPFVLCPDVVSPTVLSGVVLSPSVLSPSVFTESALSLNILSPTVLS